MTLAVAVLVASLIGSVHCAAMCGAFVCFYGSGSRGAGGSWSAGPHVAYNLGRLASYVLLGVVAGFAGHALDAAGILAGIQRGAAIVAGTLMVIWGGHTVLAARGVRVQVVSVPVAWQRAMGGVLLTVRERPPVVRAAATGLVTTLLPCGWLYTFVVSAAATGSAAGGALVMCFFWLGTLPMMFAVGIGARRLMGPFAARLPLISGAAVMVLGFLSIVGRIGASAVHVTHTLHAVP
ncbi:MAG: sulfite exporter TauE/SafE family protein [Gemmatimonadota bacterium]